MGIGSATFMSFLVTMCLLLCTATRTADEREVEIGPSSAAAQQVVHRYGTELVQVCVLGTLVLPRWPTPTEGCVGNNEGL